MCAADVCHAALGHDFGSRWPCVFAEANNLTNQPLRYYQGVTAHTKQAEYYQARFNLGLKLDL